MFLHMFDPRNTGDSDTAFLMKKTEVKPGRVVNTAGDYKYQFFPAPHLPVEFMVNAPRDAHIALASELQEGAPMYEVTIGGGHNTKTFIQKDRDIKHTVDTPNILGDGFRGFWIRWDGGEITFGRHGQPTPLVQWTDPKPIKICFIGVTTSFKATGAWQFDDVKTDDHVDFEYFPAPNGFLKFRVKANCGARIALTGDPIKRDPMYLVTIGDNANKETSIENTDSQSTKPKVVVETDQILHNVKFCGFWIYWDSRIIAMGREGEKILTVFRSDPNPFPIFYFGIGTVGSSGSWKIEAPRSCLNNLPLTVDPGIWIKATKGQIPPSAVDGGYDVTTGEVAYVARSTYNNVKIPGQVTPTKGCAQIIHNEMVHTETDYEVLVRGGYNWVTTSGKNIPPGAFVAGESKDAEALYIGRIYKDDIISLGWVTKSSGVCTAVTDEGKEFTSDRYEILMSY